MSDHLKQAANEIAMTIPYSTDEVYRYLCVCHEQYIKGGYSQIEAVDLAKIATVKFLERRTVEGY